MQRCLGVLIGGSSHVGKSTLSKQLAAALDIELISTDDLARHPGRSWPGPRPQVAEYYERLSDETLHWFLKVHHENMWPRIGHIMEDRLRRSTPFILEGSALRPEYMATVDSALVKSVFLYAEDDFLRCRMIDESGFDSASPSAEVIIEKFIGRSIRDNREMLKAARGADLQCVDVARPDAIEALLNELVSRFNKT